MKHTLKILAIFFLFISTNAQATVDVMEFPTGLPTTVATSDEISNLELTDLTDVNSSTQGNGRLLMSHGDNFHSVQASDLYFGFTSNSVIFANNIGTLGVDNSNLTFNDVSDTFYGKYISTTALDLTGWTQGMIPFEGTTYLEGDANFNYNNATDTLNVPNITVSGTWTGIELTDLSDVNSSTQGAGRILVSSGSAFHSVVFTGDATMNEVGSISLAANTVTANELADIASVTQGAGRILISDGVNFNSTLISKDALLSSNGELTIDHGDLDGLSDDDHTQYLELDGSDSMTDSLTITKDQDALTYLKLQNTNSGVATENLGVNFYDDAAKVFSIERINNTGETTMNNVSGDLIISTTTSGDIIFSSANDTISLGDDSISTTGTITGGTWSGIGLTDLEDVNSATQGAGRILVSDGASWNSSGVITINPANTTITTTGGNNLNIASSGGANNEGYTYDFHTTPNQISLSSSTSADYFRLTNLGIFLSDDEDIVFGNGSDVYMLWDSTDTNDSFKVGLDVNNAAFSGYFMIMEDDDMASANRAAPGTSADPILRIWDSDATVSTNWVDMFSNNGTGLVRSGTHFRFAMPDEKEFALAYGSGNGESMVNIVGSTTKDQVVWGMRSNSGMQVVYGTNTYAAYDYDHAATSYPTVYIHSDKSPDTDNTEYMALYTDNTNSNIVVGSGELNISGGDVRVWSDFYIGHNIDADPALIFDGDTSDGQISYDEDNSVLRVTGAVGGVSCPIKTASFAAEESADLAPGYVFSFGNGEVGSENGIIMPCDGKLVAMTVMCMDQTTTTSTVEVQINATGTDCETDVDTASGNVFYGSDLACSDTFSAGDLINFYVIDDDGACATGETATVYVQFD